MKPQRSAMSKIDPHTLRVILSRNVCLEAFKMPARHKVARSVWESADKPTGTAMALLVEGLQTPKDTASLRKMATIAKQNIQCSEHTQIVGYIPDNANAPCEMCNIHVMSAI